MNFFLLLHSWFRWLVLIAAVVAIWRMVSGYTKGQPWSREAMFSGLRYTIALDIQFLLGVILYGLSPVTRRAMANATTALPDARFFLLHHPLAMFASVILAHVGMVIARKAATDRARFGWASVFFTLSVVCILAGIPWFRPLFRGLSAG